MGLLTDVRGVLSGHVWTVLPHLRARFASVAPTDTPWATTIPDASAAARPIRITGALSNGAASDTLVLLVHGLGGSADSGYVLDAAQAVVRAGWASLRINLRGADRLGGDIYHAGLARDLSAIVADASLASFRRILVVGFSMGGHLALHHGCDPDPRVTAIAALNSPLDLEAGARAIDRRRALPYRHHVLHELKACYRVCAARRDIPTHPFVVDRVTTIRDWDRWTVVPRFGFADVEDYYARASVGPRLPELKVPAIYLGSPHDPMVPRWTVQRWLDAAPPRLDVRWLPATGHVGYPHPPYDDLLSDLATR